MAHIIKTIFLSGPAGHLESLLEKPHDSVRIEQAVVLCHPHPQHGGTMHNKVMYRLARAARKSGSAVLRFNFRGVGTSSGFYDEGQGEQDDLRAALHHMQDQYPEVKLIVGGFSFGARVALRVCCSFPGIEKIISVGTPVEHGNWSFLAQCYCPKHFIQSTQDEYGSRQVLEQVYYSAAKPKKLTWVLANDHFFKDALDDMESSACSAYT